MGHRRRELLRLGAGVAAATVTPRAARSGPTASQRLRTPLTDLLGIDHPVVQAPMGGVVTPELVAAVGAAGGLGILAATGVKPEDLRAQIRKVRELSDRPFGVNLILHSELYPHGPSTQYSDEVVRQVQAVLNGFRAKLGIPPTEARPPVPPNPTEAAIEVILAEAVPVFSIGLGEPSRELVARFHERGAKVIAMAATVPDAREVAEAGVDAVVAQGSEAGGHRSTWVKRPSAQHAAVGTLALVPQVVDAVKRPVIAAGGIADGRGLAAVLALGAGGAFIGTRFLATRESGAPPFYKQAVASGDSDATTVTDAFTGLYARVLRNAYSEQYAASGAPVLPAVVQQLAAADVTAASARQESGEYFAMYAGQGCGLIRELPAAADVLREIVREAGQLISDLARRRSSS
jgi:nitronate monooxygenase